MTNRQKIISKERRRRVLVKYPRCVYCGRDYATHYIGEATVDHVFPVSRGGTKDDINLVGACRACNTSKGDRTPEEWAADILAVFTAIEAYFPQAKGADHVEA